jgi:hypothetical protein
MSRQAVEDDLEIHAEVRFEEDPFAGEVFIPDVDDPAANATVIEDFGVPQHDNLLTESTADYLDRAPSQVEPTMTEPDTAPDGTSMPRVAEQVAAYEAAPAPQKNGNGHQQPIYAALAEPYRLAKVVLSRSGDSLLDAARVGEAHRLLASCPGPDRFCFLVKALGETLQLDFPNDTTTLDEMMIDQLKGLHGVESVQISMNL